MDWLKFIIPGIMLWVFNTPGLYAQNEIYLIRHAKVNLSTPCWINYKMVIAHRQAYDQSPIVDIDAAEVLAKIDHFNEIDTVFVSPQMRARQTAIQIFGNRVHYHIDSGLKELDYPIVCIPLVIMPTPVWLGLSRATWMMGVNTQGIPTLKEEMEKLKIVADELIIYARRNQRTVVIAHGMVNRQLRKILKRSGWKVMHSEGHTNLAVNKLVFQQNN